MADMYAEVESTICPVCNEESLEPTTVLVPDHQIVNDDCGLVLCHEHASDGTTYIFEVVEEDDGHSFGQIILNVPNSTIPPHLVNSSGYLLLPHELFTEISDMYATEQQLEESPTLH